MKYLTQKHFPNTSVNHRMNILAITSTSLLLGAYKASAENHSGALLKGLNL